MCNVKHRPTAPKKKLAERRMQKLYDRFPARTISVKELVFGLSYFVPNEKAVSAISARLKGEAPFTT
jgi:hypothetical protein